MLWSNALWMILLAGILGEVKTNRLPQFSQEKRAKSIDEQQPIGKDDFDSKLFFIDFGIIRPILCSGISIDEH